jgi:t-SNARE complex subunit (syntaxin)
MQKKEDTGKKTYLEVKEGPLPAERLSKMKLREVGSRKIIICGLYVLVVVVVVLVIYRISFLGNDAFIIGR